MDWGGGGGLERVKKTLKLCAEKCVTLKILHNSDNSVELNLPSRKGEVAK